MDFDEVLGLKASAKDARRDMDWSTAIDDLDEAASILQEMAPSGTNAGQIADSLASELADTYGMIGGVERRWGLASSGDARISHLDLSTRAYDKGFQYEKHLSIGNATTYNRINRIVARVLARPVVIANNDDTSIDIFSELETAERLVRDQLEASRMRDPWAYCDLITIQLLRGVDPSLPTINELSTLRPPAFVYESTLETLTPLAAAASSVRPEFEIAVPRLQKLMSEAR
jgi:hypothetical protein